MGESRLETYCKSIITDSISTSIEKCERVYVNSFWCFGLGMLICIVGLMLKQPKSSSEGLTLIGLTPLDS
ncbi:hypothetical protein KIPB_013667 [Kipferlia bialata]|uniref:Uncharacterized protein n=1 Tax=Kipferlia bialata TaxID=797122 RepID=A0A9K3DBG2_9EUKA|nr:hypothetical protein KIPB_013667 [Kipferlia bialata]|eukprot:g13667.t1